YNLQQHHQMSQGIMYGNLRSSPSPHPQSYPNAIDYHAQMAMMVPPTPLYGQGNVNPASLHSYQHAARPGRRGASGVDHRVAIRSPLLDDFRANKTRKWELKDIYGYVVEFSGDQHGSRFIQQKIETASTEEKQVIFDEIVPHNALQLIQDVFGNYVIQKLFEHGTQVQKTILANTMEGHILPLSLQMYGCRVVQKAIEYVLPDQQSVFVQELEADVLRCVKDANGNHVIQKLIEQVSPERLSFIKAFKGNVYELATHPYGCRVLQRCFEHLPEEYIRPLLDELHKHVNHLMQDQFGNYVVQFVLEHGNPHDRAVVVSKLRGQMLHMARHKFASNVCEKALVTADSESRRLLIEEMMTPKQDGLSPVLTMMKDQYANYVLQRALSVVEGEQKATLISKVKPQLINMRRYSSAYSKHLMASQYLLFYFLTMDGYSDDS
ncbi:ARM repeat-containing protein, partial [Laetiporus sulphureus 93-53]